MSSLDNIEKFFWQIVIGALIFELPTSIITTSEDKIIWLIIYHLLVLIVITIFSIIKYLLISRNLNNNHSISSTSLSTNPLIESLTNL